MPAGETPSLSPSPSTREQPKTIDLRGEIPSFEHIFADAELLLSYAATAGKSLNDADVKLLTDEIAAHKAAEKAAPDVL
jgi:hypothetical protein